MEKIFTSLLTVAALFSFLIIDQEFYDPKSPVDKMIYDNNYEEALTELNNDGLEQWILKGKALYELGLIYERIFRLTVNEQLQAYEISLRENHDFYLNFFYARCLFLNGKYEKSAALFDKLVAAPESSDDPEIKKLLLVWRSASSILRDSSAQNENFRKERLLLKEIKKEFIETDNIMCEEKSFRSSLLRSFEKRNVFWCNSKQRSYDKYPLASEENITPWKPVFEIESVRYFDPLSLYASSVNYFRSAAINFQRAADACANHTCSEKFLPVLKERTALSYFKSRDYSKAEAYLIGSGSVRSRIIKEWIEVTKKEHVDETAVRKIIKSVMENDVPLADWKLLLEFVHSVSFDKISLGELSEKFEEMIKKSDLQHQLPKRFQHEMADYLMLLYKNENTDDLLRNLKKYNPEFSGDIWKNNDPLFLITWSSLIALSDLSSDYTLKQGNLMSVKSKMPALIPMIEAFQVILENKFKGAAQKPRYDSN